MRKESVRCALLAALLARHAWGSNSGGTSAGLRRHLGGAVSAGTVRLRPAARGPIHRQPGERGVELDPGEFGVLADLLYYDWGRDPFEIRLRLKHYEGWNDHEWA